MRTQAPDRTRAGANVLIGLLAAALVLVLAAPAAAATTGSVTMFSDGDPIGGGVPRLFDERNANLALSGTGEELSVDVEGGTLGGQFQLTFAAPRGEELRRGVYVRAQRAVFRTAVRPGIEIGGNARGCNTIGGNFEVKEIGYDADGRVTRVWLLYAQYCEEGPRALFGEVRVGFPDDGGAVAAAPSMLRWPAAEPGRAGTAVPVTVRPSRPTEVRAVTLAGIDRDAFSIHADECSGRALAAGESCQVWVIFSPPAAGARRAALRIEPVAGSPREVPLEGFSHGGRTKVMLESEAGDWIGGGRAWSYTNANALITAGGTPTRVSVGVSGADGTSWGGTFDPAHGDIIAEGHYPSATRYPFNGPGPGLSFDGEGRACNHLLGEFTVTNAVFGDDGQLQAFAATFEQHCEGTVPALRGTIEYRAGDTTPLPSWLSDDPQDGGGDPTAPGRVGESSVSILSDADDYVGAGLSRLYHERNAQIAIFPKGSDELVVAVEGGGFGDRFYLAFAAPAGETLRPGLYLRAQRASFRDSGRAGIDISGNGRGCNNIGGNFEVKDIAFDAAGEVERLWLVYAQHCEGVLPALFGEVRVGLPPDDRPIDGAPSIVRWPAAGLGRPSATVPVTVRATRPTEVRGAAVAGAGASAFEIRFDECTGRVLAPGASCRIWVQFAAATAGTRRATLRVETTDGVHRAAALDGFSRGGVTRVVMAGDPGEYVSGGRQRVYTNANAVISGAGSRSFVNFDVEGADSPWHLRFAAPTGEVLAPGRYAPATRYPDNPAGAGFSFSGDGRVCNRSTGEFTVTAAAFEEDGTLRAFSADFKQHCEGAEAALRGSVEYRNGDSTSLPPWLGGPEDPQAGDPLDPDPVGPTEPDPAGPSEPAEPGAEASGAPAPVDTDTPASPGRSPSAGSPGALAPAPPPAPAPPAPAGEPAAPASPADVPPSATPAGTGAVSPVARVRRIVSASKGSALVTLACPRATGRCRGGVIVKRRGAGAERRGAGAAGRSSAGAAIGRSAFNVRAGATRRLRIRLAPGARRVLARRGSLSVIVQVREGAGTRDYRATIRMAARRG